MSLDTKYRPKTFDSVLGQQTTRKILKRFIELGTGFRQSYVFAGPYGSGKTTLARIFARGLLCDDPQEGNPCDKCLSCLTILEQGASDLFIEVDAATNSGKANILKILEDLTYSTFSGKRRLYLFDEAHQLSTDALDALLKPLEDTIQGSKDKRLVCLFCTTEPEKMKQTIFSRCAPVFTVQAVTPEEIADRLEFICKEETILYEKDCLRLIAEATDLHIRDAIKSIEGISLLGSVNQENVSSYLKLDTQEKYVDVLLSIGKDLPLAISIAEQLLQQNPPSVVYQKLCEIAVNAYMRSLGVSRQILSVPSDKIQLLTEKGNDLLRYVQLFSSKPYKPSASMVLCDIASLHNGINTVQVEVKATPPAPITEKTVTPKNSVPLSTPSIGTVEKMLQSVPTVEGEGIYYDPKADSKNRPSVTKEKKSQVLTEMPAEQFALLLNMRLKELNQGNG